nr:MAG TPA: LPXTG cell wall anchor motif domain protein [Caudoviricetes sp.]
MKKQLITSIAIATILTAGTVKADAIFTTPKETLPETGDSATLAITVLGFLAVALGFGLFLNKRKK